MSKTVLITGSSTGIGRAAVIKFQQEGWQVAATMRSPEKESELQDIDGVSVIKMDVNDPASVDDAVAGTLETFGSIDAVVNNAGYGAVGPAEMATEERMERQFSTNVYGPIRVMKAVLPHMRNNGGGVIVNITSIGGRVGVPLNALYCGTKFALEGITETMRYEVAPFGIRMKLVEPGGVVTEFMNNIDMPDMGLTDAYNEFMQNVMQKFQGSRDGYSTSEKIAGVIYDAAIDESPRLRYPAGDDADALMGLRDSGSDADVFATIEARFG